MPSCKLLSTHLETAILSSTLCISTVAYTAELHLPALGLDDSAYLCCAVAHIQ